MPYAVSTYRRLAAALPGTALHYAVKANPDPTLLAALARSGCRFDVASPAEITAALMAGAEPRDLVYSNPVKRREDVRFAARLGVDLFVVDSPGEVAKVAEAAPGSRVLCRLVTSGEGSDWPLSRKYGCSTGETVAILRDAARLGLRVDGVSFHVGSQQRDPEAWAGPIGAAATVFETLRADGLDPWLLDIGGGFPARLDDGCPPPEAYGAAIERHLDAAFGDQPADHDRRARPRHRRGRRRPGHHRASGCVHRAGTRWVFLDAGVFTGLVETLDEAIRYPFATDVPGPTGPCVLSGPTCDSADVLYEDAMVELPLALAEGDEVRFHCAGAYTATLLDRRLQRLRTAHHGRPRRMSDTGPAGRSSDGCSRRTRAPRSPPGLPWPLLLVLVWDQYGDGPARRLGRRPGRRGPDGAVRPAVVGGRLARRPRPRGTGWSGRRWRCGCSSWRSRASRVTGDRIALGVRRGFARGCRRYADLPRDRGLAAGAGRRPAGAGDRPAGHHRGLAPGWSARRSAGSCSPSRCGPGPSPSPLALAVAGLALSAGVSIPSPVEKAPDAVAGMLRAVLRCRPALGALGVAGLLNLVVDRDRRGAACR